MQRFMLDAKMIQDAGVQRVLGVAFSASYIVKYRILGVRYLSYSI